MTARPVYIPSKPMGLNYQLAQRDNARPNRLNYGPNKHAAAVQTSAFLRVVPPNCRRGRAVCPVEIGLVWSFRPSGEGESGLCRG